MASKQPGEKRKVLQIGKYYPPYRGGMETHLQLLCQKIKDRFEVSVIVSNDRNESMEENMDGINVTRLPRILNLGAAPICRGMAGKIAQSKADIIHVHLPHPSAVLATLASRSKGKLVVTYHSDVIRQRILGKIFEPILHSFLKRADAIIATSPNYIDGSPVLRRHRDRCRVVPHGILTDSYENVNPNEVDAILNRFGPPLILAVGRLTYYKGFQHLIRAMGYTDGILLIIGDGPMRESLQEEISHRGLTGRVFLIGEVPDVVPYYHACSMFVLPSIARSEAFGIVQLEAMACGKPVINTALNTGVPFVSPDGLTGLTVKPGDVQGFASAIRYLLNNTERAMELGKQGRLRVRQLFHLDLMAGKTMDLYEQVMSGAMFPSDGRDELQYSGIRLS